MTNLVMLLLAVALVSVQYFTVYAQIDDEKLDLENNVMPNEIPVHIPSTKRRSVAQYVKITSSPPDTTRYRPGTTLVLECEVMGNPAPSAGWLKNGVPVSEFDEGANEIFSIELISAARLISKHVIRGASDGDVYTCVGSSTLREDHASTTIYVEGNADLSDSLVNQIMPSTPIITATYQDLLQTMGTSVTLPCRVFSPMKSQIIWMNNTGKVVYGNSKYRVLPTGDLHIKNLSWGDMGGWTCMVKNAFGKDVAETFLYPLKAG